MTQPLVKPTHLAPPADEPWLARRKAALVAMILGIVSFLVVAIVHGKLSSTPDWQVSVPGFAATAIASVISLARREPGYWLWAIGLGLAAASLVLGWFLMIAIIVAATAAVILVLHTVM